MTLLQGLFVILFVVLLFSVWVSKKIDDGTL